MPERADLNILCWEGYEDPNVIEPFTERHGYSVRAETIVSDADAAARIVGPERSSWDVVNLNNPFARETLYPAGAIRALPRDRFADEYDRLLPQFDDLYRVDPKPGRERHHRRLPALRPVQHRDRRRPDRAGHGGIGRVPAGGRPGQQGTVRSPRIRRLQYLPHLFRRRSRSLRRALPAEQLDAFEAKARQWFAGRGGGHRRSHRDEPGAGRRRHRVLPVRRHVHRLSRPPGRPPPHPRRHPALGGRSTARAPSCSWR